MNYKKLLIYAGLVLTISSCSKKNDNSTNPSPNNGGGKGDTTVTTPPKPYAITETFESGTKTAYIDANVTLSTGSWDFNDALIGNLAGDVKDGNWSVRLRTGDLAMNFDINDVTLISLKHAKFGSDASSTWQLMESTDGGSTYTQLASINETSTTFITDSFKVTTNTKVRFKILKTGTTRINIDDITFKGTGDPGVTVAPPDGSGGDQTGSTSSTPRGVTIGTDAPPTTGDNSNLLFGNPSGASTSMAMMDNYLIDQGYYVESYNATKEEPNWVSWHLDATNTTKVSDRLNNFAAFSGLQQGWYAVQDNDYDFSKSGFERGHNCPSADRTSSVDANSSTFLMTNMIPQAPNNNENTWANLEDYLRSQLTGGNEVYIVMGSYGTGGTSGLGSFNTISYNSTDHINVPSNIWKVAIILPAGDNDIMRVTASTRIIAVNTPNINSTDADWTKYIVTLKSIEDATGYNIFSALPANVKTALESVKDPGI